MIVLRATLILALLALANGVSAKPVIAVAQSVPAECKPSKIQRLDALVGGHRFAKFADTKVGRIGMTGWDKANSLGGKLTGAIKRTLNPGERQQAEAASTIAMCQGTPGREVRWVSNSRAGVSGTSTVTARIADATLGQCMEIRDVVIVNGEETRTSKRMCRASGASGYTLAV